MTAAPMERPEPSESPVSADHPDPIKDVQPDRPPVPAPPPAAESAEVSQRTVRTQWSPAALYQVPAGQPKPGLRWFTPAWLAVGSGLALSALGILAIGTTRPELAAKQLTFFLVGIAACAAVAIPDVRWIRRAVVALAVLAIALLVFVLIPFVPEAIVRPRNGARAWIALGPVDFQPSELAKTVFILAMALWLSSTTSQRTMKGLLAIFAVSLVPIALILAEPDLGSALLFLPTLGAMLVAAGARLRALAIGVVLALAMVPVAYGFLLRPYQRARIDTIIAQIAGDTRFEKREGFQGWRAMRLVGSGGLFGVGEDHARALVRFNGLPEEHNDMIFAVICCRWGVMGGFAVWGAFLVYALGGLAVAALARDGFSRLVAVGVVALHFSQMTINTGMTIGVLPITGITLPFVSYGGSSLVATWINTGLLLGIGLRRPRPGERAIFDVVS